MTTGAPGATGATEGPFIHAGTAVGHRRFATGREVDYTRTVRAPFQEPRPGSVWHRTIFRPVYDPFDVAQAQFDVKTKGGRIVPFAPFETQRRYVQRMGLRNVVVKPRQVGMSTINLMLETAIGITVPNLGFLIITHRDDTTDTMRQTIRSTVMRLVQDRSWNLEFGVDNADALQIMPLDTWFFFGTAGGSQDSGVGRSRTIQFFHASELAHWKTAEPGKVLSGITESVPDTGIVLLESTPNGATGPFYNTFAGRNAYVKHFYPWFIETSRKLTLPAGYQLRLTDDEQSLVSTYGLSHEQIAWRRWKQRDLETQGLEFLQEYPEDEISCFTAGVRSAFPTKKLIAMLRRAEVTPYADTEMRGEAHDPGGFLRVWQQPLMGEHYIAAGDVGGGHRDGDESVLYVGNQRTGQIVAMLAGRWQPETFGELSVQVARKYNEAYLSHESNGLGRGAVNKAVRDLGYRNYHWEKRRGETNDEFSAELAPGFYITSYSRTPLLRGAIQAVLEDDVLCWDAELMRQMTAAQLVRGRQAGGWADQIQIPQEVHDDRLMAFAQFLALRRMLIIDPRTNRAKPMQVA